MRKVYYTTTTTSVEPDPYIGRKFICNSSYVHTVIGYFITISERIILQAESGNFFLSDVDFIAKEVNETK